MSADNGFVVRKDTRGNFVLQEYSASADYFPPINSPRAELFDTLQDAALRYSEISQTGHIIEYGLSIHINEETPDGILDEPPVVAEVEEDDEADQLAIFHEKLLH